jgi:hypothetical protein
MKKNKQKNPVRRKGSQRFEDRRPLRRQQMFPIRHPLPTFLKAQNIKKSTTYDLYDTHTHTAASAFYFFPLPGGFIPDAFLAKYTHSPPAFVFLTHPSLCQHNPIEGK